MRELNVVSLFCGCGGLDYGFHVCGFSTRFACDIDPLSVSVYNQNLEQVAEEWDVTSQAFRSRIAEIDSCDVVLGGFPCQGFSKAGPKRESDPRNALFWSMCSAVEQLKPSMFIAENVDGIAQNFSGTYIRLIENAFRGLGYRLVVLQK